jgi:hypothetical protein
VKCRMAEQGYEMGDCLNVKLGNYSVFAQIDEDWDKLLATVGQAGIG